MGVIINKKEGESPNSMIFRFTKKVQQSGVLRETKKRRFTKRATSKPKRRASALHKIAKKLAHEKAKKMGLELKKR